MDQTMDKSVSKSGKVSVKAEKPDPNGVRKHYCKGSKLVLVCLFVAISLVIFILGMVNFFGTSGVGDIVGPEKQSEDQSARLLLDALSGYEMPFATDIKVVNSKTSDSGEEGCPEGYEHLFQKVWLGIEEGCAYNGLIMSEVAYQQYYAEKEGGKSAPECANHVA